MSGRSESGIAVPDTPERRRRALRDLLVSAADAAQRIRQHALSAFDQAPEGSRQRASGSFGAAD
jgi:hypothetical protein